MTVRDPVTSPEIDLLRMKQKFSEANSISTFILSGAASCDEELELALSTRLCNLISEIYPTLTKMA